MNSIKLLKIIKYFIYALAATPLIITPMTMFPFMFGRGMIAQFLIEIIFFLYLALAIVDKNYRPKKSALLILTGLFLCAMFVSSIFGVHFERSFWSSVERLSGLFSLMHAFALFVVLGAVFKSKNDWKNFFGANILVSISMFAIAVLSLFGVKFWGVDLGTRISGSLGNPIFLATYFMLNIIFAFYLALEDKNKKLKYFWALCAIILFIGVILTQSRGAVLGFLAGVIFGLLLYCFFGARGRARYAAICGVLAIAAMVIVLGVFKDSHFIKNNDILKRLAHISLTSTGGTRLMSWKIAWLAIAERPVLGWGMEGFDVAFNKYYNPEFLKYSYYETWFDKPHNKVLEVAVDGGATGLILYLSIFIYSFYLLRQKTKRGELTPAISFVFAGGLLAYFAQNLFVFDTPVSYILFFILLAFLGFSEKEDIAPPQKISIFLFLIFLIGGVSLAWYLNIIPFNVSIKLRSSVLGEGINKKINLEIYREGIGKFNPYKYDWRSDLAKSVISSFVRGDGFYSKEEAEFALNEMKKNLDKYPNSVFFNMFLGILYAEMGPSDNRYFTLAKERLHMALTLSPKRQHLYFAMARMYVVMKDRENLIKFSQKAIDLEPKTYISYWEGAKQLLLMDANDPAAFEWLRQAVELGFWPEDDNDFKWIFKIMHNYFFEQKNYRVLSHFYERWQRIEPNEAKWYAQKATAQYMLGEKDDAILEIKKAIELDSSYKMEGEEFIRLIEAGK